MSKETLIESPTLRSANEETDSGLFIETAQNPITTTTGSMGFLPVPSFPAPLEGFLDSGVGFSPEIDEFVESVLVRYLHCKSYFLLHFGENLVTFLSLGK